MRYFTMLCLLLMIAGIARAEEPFKELNFDAALAAAQKDNKIIMIDFYTTWCGPCKKLDSTTWKDEQVRSWLSEKTVALKIDAEKEEALAARYKINSYPTIIFIKADGNEMDRIIGYRDAQEFLLEAKDSLAGRDSVTRAKERLVGENQNNPSLRMDYGEALLQKGRYKEAFDELIWCFDNGEKSDPSFAGVRFSFLLGSIVQLGRNYPQAIDALKTRRDGFQTELLAGKDVRVNAFGVAQINEELNEKERNIVVFDQLKEQGKNGKAAREIFLINVFEQLLKARRYQDINDNIGDIKVKIDQEFEKFDRFEANPYFKDKPEQKEQIAVLTRRTIVRGTGRIYEMLIGMKRMTEAAELSERMLKFSKTGMTFAELIRRSESAGAAELKKEFRQRGEKELSEAEREKMMEALLNPKL